MEFHWLERSRAFSIVFEKHFADMKPGEVADGISYHRSRFLDETEGSMTKRVFKRCTEIIIDQGQSGPMRLRDLTGLTLTDLLAMDYKSYLDIDALCTEFRDEYNAEKNRLKSAAEASLKKQGIM